MSQLPNLSNLRAVSHEEYHSVRKSHILPELIFGDRVSVSLYKDGGGKILAAAVYVSQAKGLPVKRSYLLAQTTPRPCRVCLESPCGSPASCASDRV